MKSTYAILAVLCMATLAVACGQTERDPRRIDAGAVTGPDAEQQPLNDADVPCAPEIIVDVEPQSSVDDVGQNVRTPVLTFTVEHASPSCDEAVVLSELDFSITSADYPYWCRGAGCVAPVSVDDGWNFSEVLLVSADGQEEYLPSSVGFTQLSDINELWSHFFGPITLHPGDALVYQLALTVANTDQARDDLGDRHYRVVFEQAEAQMLNNDLVVVQGIPNFDLLFTILAEEAPITQRFYADPDGDAYGTEGDYIIADEHDDPPDGYMRWIGGRDADNCPYTYNPDQADTDADGMGDACDTADPPSGDGGAGGAGGSGGEAGSDAPGGAAGSVSDSTSPFQVELNTAWPDSENVAVPLTNNLMRAMSSYIITNTGSDPVELSGMEIMLTWDSVESPFDAVQMFLQGVDCYNYVSRPTDHYVEVDSMYGMECTLQPGQSEILNLSAEIPAIGTYGLHSGDVLAMSLLNLYAENGTIVHQVPPQNPPVIVPRNAVPLMSNHELGTYQLQNEASIELARWTINADGGDIAWKSMDFEVTASGLDSLSELRLYKGSTQLSAGEVEFHYFLPEASRGYLTVVLTHEEHVSTFGTTYSLRATPVFTGDASLVVQWNPQAYPLPYTGMIACTWPSGALPYQTWISTDGDALADYDTNFLWSDLSGVSHSDVCGSSSDWTTDWGLNYTMEWRLAS